MDLTPFDFHGSPVRVVTVDDQPWFVARDVADVLDIAQAGVAVRALDHDEVTTTHLTDALGRSQVTYIVSEPGLYSLILRSRKPEAKEFKRWITHEVIPAIRRHGGYLTPEMTERVLLDPDTIIRLATDLKTARAEAALHAREVAELTPRAEAWDVMVSAAGDYAVDEAAKILSRDQHVIIGRNRLFSLMSDLGWVYRAGARGRWHARQDQVDNGRLVQRMSAAFLNARTGEMEAPAPTIRVTPKGLDSLRRHIKEAA